MPIDNTALTFVPHLPCRRLPAFANVEQERTQQTELELAKRAPAANEETAGLAGTDEAATPAADKQARHSRHERGREALLTHDVQSSKHGKRDAKQETLHIAREAHGSKHEAKHDTTRIAREAHGSKHEAKHDTTHIAREGHAPKREAAHAPHGGRERHRSA
jgi:hypothetical protein